MGLRLRLLGLAGDQVQFPLATKPALIQNFTTLKVQPLANQIFAPDANLELATAVGGRRGMGRARGATCQITSPGVMAASNKIVEGIEDQYCFPLTQTSMNCKFLCVFPQLLPDVRVEMLRRWLAGVIAVAIALGAIATFSLMLPTPAWAEDYNEQDLTGVDFSGQDLTSASFNRATLRDSDMSHANLAGVSLFGAILERTNLEGADLRYSTLDKARFLQTNLKNALLEGAYAFNAKFRGANIEGADFTDVFLREDDQKQLCANATGTNPITGRDTRDTLYCEDFES